MTTTTVVLRDLDLVLSDEGSIRAELEWAHLEYQKAQQNGDVQHLMKASCDLMGAQIALERLIND
jgi:hypothetical protein